MTKAMIGASEASANPDMPAFGRSVARLSTLDDERTNLNALCEIALADPALAQKILRAAKSARMGSAAAAASASLSRAIMALGLEQVRSMALALDALAAARAKGLDAAMVKTELSKALCAAFCARELAKIDGLEPEAAALRSLFLGCCEIFCALYEPYAWAQAQSIAKRKGAPWWLAFEALNGGSRAEFCERLMRAWGLDDRLSAPLLRSEADPARAITLSAMALSEAFCDPDPRAAVFHLRPLWLEDPARAQAAIAGLERGAMVGANAGVGCASALHASASRQEPIDWSATLGPPDPFRPYFLPALPPVSPSDADPADLLPLASDEIVRRFHEGRGPRSLSQLALETLCPALGMSHGLCAFGPSVQEARLLYDFGGAKNWARDFVEARRSKKADLFHHALARGMDAMTRDASFLKGSLPAEISPATLCAPKAFCFYPLIVNGAARGYILMSSPKALPELPANLKTAARDTCSRLSECLAEVADRL